MIYIGAVFQCSKTAWLSDSYFIAQPKIRVCTTENQGLHNRKSGFAQPKIRVCTTENQGLHNRKSGFAQPKIRVLSDLQQPNKIYSCGTK